MMEKSEKEQFLNRQWYCYRLLDYVLPYCTKDNFSLVQIIRGFENFSPYFELDVDPFGCESLICATLYINAKPDIQQRFIPKKKVSKKRAAEKTVNQKEVASKKTKKNPDPNCKTVDPRPSSSHNVGNINPDESGGDDEEYSISMSQAIHSKKEFAIKVCLSTENNLLFTSRILSSWLLSCFARSLGVRTLHDGSRRNASGNVSHSQSNRGINSSQADRDELSRDDRDELSRNINDKDVDGLQIHFYCMWKGDPRHMLQLVHQRGREKDSSRSMHALTQHEWVRAQQRRLRPPGAFAPPGCSSFPMGDVTKGIGAFPDNFPTVQRLGVTVRNVPMLPTLLPSTIDIDPDVLEECKARLSQGTISTLRLQLSSASLLHLYYNTCLEASVARNNTLGALRHTLRALEAPLSAPEAPSDAQSAGAFWALSGRAYDGYLSASDEDELSTSASKTKKAETTKKKKKKSNVDGVVTEVPVFLDNLRSTSAINTIVDYQGLF